MMNFENIKVAMMTRVNALVKFPTFDLTLKGAGGGGGLIQSIGQENACHFSQDHTNGHKIS